MFLSSSVDMLDSPAAFFVSRSAARLKRWGFPILAMLAASGCALLRVGPVPASKLAAFDPLAEHDGLEAWRGGC